MKYLNDIHNNINNEKVDGKNSAIMHAIFSTKLHYHYSLFEEFFRKTNLILKRAKIYKNKFKKSHVKL